MQYCLFFQDIHFLYWCYVCHSVHIKDCVESKHELIQVLHHAYVYNFRTVLLLIGDSSTTILRGVYIKFPRALLNTYGNVLHSVYLMSLKWAYTDDSLPEEVVKEELQEIKGVDFDSFIEHFKLWRNINTKIPRPLPKLQRVIPRIFSTWNSMKGGSDSTTHLLCHVKEGNLVPRHSSQVRYLFLRFFNAL